MNSAYPKDYRENMEWRRSMLLRCAEDEAYLASVKELFFRDPLFAFNAFFYTLDVRKKPVACRPFCTYPYQDDVILELVETIRDATALNTMDIALEKSRDMGGTWMVLDVFEWFWLNPKAPADFLLGSRKEDYVDKIGDSRTHFHKLRYTLDKLPSWLLPKGFSFSKHDNFMRLINPETGASITGESNNANFSTQGRYTAILFDEFAKWETTDIAAWTAAGDASPCRVALSTPFGAAGKHYELVTDGKTRKIVMHWSLHPEKREGLACMWPKSEESGETVDEYNWIGLTSEWYEKERKRRTPQEVAQELDIDYIGAGSPVFDGAAGKRILTLQRNPRDFKAYKLNLEEFGPGSLNDVYSFVEETTNLVDYEEYLYIFDPPKISSNYIIAADIAEGLERGDYGVIKCLERETESVAATFAGKINEIDIAKVVCIVTKIYTFPDREEPWWAVETNGPGLATFDLLTDHFDLPNPYMMLKFDVARQQPSFKKGWWTDTNSRRALVSGLKEWLQTSLGWCDQRCCREMTTFVRSKSGKPEAKEGCNDDEVMCFGIALQVNKLAPYDEYVESLEAPTQLHEFAQASKPLEIPILSIEDKCMAHALGKQKLLAPDDYMDQILGEASHLINNY